MPFTLAAATALGAGANLAGGLFGQSSAKKINAQSIALSREQMRFQERMSNTAYQRSTKDLEKAGLNRILALGNPASSPGGAQPPSLKVPGEHLQRGISSALQGAQIAAQIGLTRETTRKVRNEADISQPEAEVKGRLGRFLDKLMDDVGDYIPKDFGLSTARDAHVLGNLDKSKLTPVLPPSNKLPPVYGEPEKREEFKSRNNSKAAIRSRRREAYNKWLDAHPKATYKESQRQKIHISNTVH